MNLEAWIAKPGGSRPPEEEVAEAGTHYIPHDTDANISMGSQGSAKDGLWGRQIWREGEILASRCSGFSNPVSKEKSFTAVAQD